MRRFPPERIVCLTEETVETLYLLGEQDRIVGVTGYAVRPRRVRREKPRVGAFTSADVDKIVALEPDIVLAFSDLQAPIAADLARAGLAAHLFNHRDAALVVDIAQDPETLALTVTASSDDDLLPPMPGVVRMNPVHAVWTVTPAGPGWASVEFQGYGNPGGNLALAPLSWFYRLAIWEAPSGYEKY